LWPAPWKLGNEAEHRGDMRRLGVTLCWQVLTFLIPMGAMLRMWGSVAIAGAVWLACMYYLVVDVRKSAHFVRFTAEPERTNPVAAGP
jgi:hypothetical protein